MTNDSYVYVKNRDKCQNIHYLQFVLNCYQTLISLFILLNIINLLVFDLVFVSLVCAKRRNVKMTDMHLKFLILLFSFIMCEAKYGYVEWLNGNAEVIITDNYKAIPSVYVAKATYNNEINSTG